MHAQVDAFLHILDVATGPEVEQYFAESKFERLQIHCALAAYHLSRGQAERARGPKAEALAKATAALNKAMTIDVNEQLPVLGLGQVALAKVGNAPIFQPRHFIVREACSLPGIHCINLRHVFCTLSCADSLDSC